MKADKVNDKLPTEKIQNVTTGRQHLGPVASKPHAQDGGHCTKVPGKKKGGKKY